MGHFCGKFEEHTSTPSYFLTRKTANFRWSHFEHNSQSQFLRPRKIRNVLVVESICQHSDKVSRSSEPQNGHNSKSTRSGRAAKSISQLCTPLHNSKTAYFHKWDFPR